MTARRMGWLAMVVLLVGVFFVGVTDEGGPATPDERAQKLAESLMCPSCRGQAVADSDSSAARGIRSYIDQRIAEGASDGQIRDELAVSFGEDILLTPERSGLAGVVWVLPVAALVGALVGMVLAFRRWRGQAPRHASDADRTLVDQALADRHGEPAPEVDVATTKTGAGST
jgi:cytochrome c-type biogenesis protein CcmH/NrfF